MVYGKLRNFEYFLASVFLILGLLMAVPYVWGVVFESKFRHEVTQLGERLHTKVTVLNYQRGWLRSRAVSRVELPYTTNALLFVHEINHGPLELEMLAQGKNPWLAALVRTELPEQLSMEGVQAFSSVDGSYFKAFTRVHLDGELDTHFSLPHLQAELHNLPVQRFSASSLRGHFVYNPEQKRIYGNLDLPRIKLEGAQMSLRLRHLHFETDQKKGEGELYFGGSQLKVAALDWQGWGRPLKVDQLELRSMNAENQQEAFSQIALSSKSVQTLLGNYSSTEFDLSLRHLDTPGVAQVINNLRHYPYYDTDELPLASRDRVWQSQVSPVLSLLRNSELELSRFYMKQGDDEVSAWMRAKMPSLTYGDWEAGEFPLQALEVELELSLSEQLMVSLFREQARRMLGNTQRFVAMKGLKAAEKEPYVRKSAESQLNNLLRQNYLAFEEGSYRLKLSLKEGHFYLNDHPLNP
ncbi:MAG: DUF945 family protein [Gammaproteobacteria bacterium]|nr:DUF945 family protein [Gammaproteobacteria bacterium]